MKKILVIGIINLVLSSCMSSKRYSTFVDSKIESAMLEPVSTQEWLIVNTEKTAPTKNICDKKKNFFIPAILYWGWNSTIDCELNIEARMDFLKRGIYKAADSLHLKQKLAGRQLEINIKEAPGKFTYVRKGNTIILLIAYTVSSVEAIIPQPINLEFEYAIKQDGNILLQGDEYIKNTEKAMSNPWKSGKTLTFLYLEEFKTEMDKMGVTLVLKVLDILK